MKIVASTQIILLGMALSVPTIVYAGTNSVPRTSQHSSSKSAKAFQKEQKKQQKKTKKAQAKAQKKNQKSLKKFRQRGQ